VLGPMAGAVYRPEYEGVMGEARVAVGKVVAMTVGLRPNGQACEIASRTEVNSGAEGDIVAAWRLTELIAAARGSVGGGAVIPTGSSSPRAARIAMAVLGVGGGDASGSRPLGNDPASTAQFFHLAFGLSDFGGGDGGGINGGCRGRVGEERDDVGVAGEADCW
jgi:hypothetical protein